MPPRRRTVPPDDARALRSLTRRIRGVDSAIDQRGALMVRLQDEGYSVGAIAAAYDANEEGVRRAIARHRARHAKPEPEPLTSVLA